MSWTPLRDVRTWLIAGALAVTLLALIVPRLDLTRDAYDVLAVVDIGAFIGLRPSGPDALAFFLVLGCCTYAAVRTWRNEHRYS